MQNSFGSNFCEQKRNFRFIFKGVKEKNSAIYYKFCYSQVKESERTTATSNDKTRNNTGIFLKHADYFYAKHTEINRGNPT